MSDSRPTILLDDGGDNVTPARGLESLHIVCTWCRKVLHQGRPMAPTKAGICTDCEAHYKQNVESGLVAVNPETGEVEHLA